MYNSTSAKWNENHSEYFLETEGGTRHTSISSDDNDFTTPILTIPSKGPGNCFVHGFLINTPVSFLVDTGADITVVRSDIWDGAEGGVLDAWKGTERLVDASGNLMRVMGTKVTSIRLGGGVHSSSNCGG